MSQVLVLEAPEAEHTPNARAKNKLDAFFYTRFVAC
jgi:hypothetical protein